jgi:quinoprotein glucose dehydrogenase
MKATSIGSSLAAFALIALSIAKVQSQNEHTGWTDYLGGPDGSHYSPLAQITPANVSKLEIAWTYEAGESSRFSFCPLVVRNVAYVAAKQGALVALDAATGKELWVRRFGAGRFGGIGSRGANYWESKDHSDRRIFVNAGGFMYAINARTGELIDSFADHGKLDLKTGIDRAPIPLASRTPGRIFENLIIVGSFTGEGYLAPPGDIRAFDVCTGKLVWVFHTIPRPGEPGYETWPPNA